MNNFWLEWFLCFTRWHTWYFWCYSHTRFWWKWHQHQHGKVSILELTHHLITYVQKVVKKFLFAIFLCFSNRSVFDCLHNNIGLWENSWNYFFGTGSNIVSKISFFFFFFFNDFDSTEMSHFIIRHKFAVWAWNMWNPCDAAAIIFFVIGLTLRFRPNTMDAGRVIYCLDSIYWYLRILNILGVNKYLG